MKKRREDVVKEIFQTPEDWVDCCGYLVKILFAVLEGKTAPPLPEGRTWEQVFEMSKHHGVESMAFAGVQELLEKDGNLYREWEKRYAENLVQCFTQEEELKKIVQELTASGIDVLLLKGCLIRDLYPERDYRQMVDMDMLIREKDRAAAGEVMRRMGYQYTPDPFEEEHHDGWQKPPYARAELHWELIPRSSPWQEFCRDVWSRKKKKKEIAGCFRMNVNDYYIFHLIHFAKHYFHMGSGIRSVLDCFLYLQKYGEELDQEYLDEWMRRLALDDFRNTVEALGRYWFGAVGKSTDKGVSEMGRRVFLSGVYGSRLQEVLRQAEKYQAEKGGVFRYIFSRIFIRREELFKEYLCLIKYPFLLPFCWAHRAAAAAISSDRTILYEIRTISSNRPSCLPWKKNSSAERKD